MSEYFRFPHTPHLDWLGPGRPRDDKVLAPDERSQLLVGEVVVEEKVDGANLGFSVREDGTLRGQSRGSYIDLDSPRGQWRPLQSWLSATRDALVDALWPNLMLFGEWCYAVHSVHYTRLPDWFLTFDVYDRDRGEFWSTDRRNALAESLGIATVPELGRGRQTVDSLRALLGQSQLTDGPAEGLYLRREVDGVLSGRAKLVRPEFVQAVEAHWSKRPLEHNQLAEDRFQPPTG